MTKISIIYITAREDCPMMGRPGVHQFKVFLDSLMEQNFDNKDFEVIICDVLYKQRKGENGKDKYDFSKHPFKIKHVDPSEFSWSLKKNLPSYADNYNLGVIHADGELLLWFNDCCELVGNDSLQLWWDWYQKGYFAHALTVYFKGGVPSKVNYADCADMLRVHDMDNEEVKSICKYMTEHGYWKDVIRDSRWKFVEDEEKKTGHGIYYCSGEHFYGYASSSLEDTLRVNGYDSNFDGQKSLNDVEMGMRLERLGCKFVCDRKLYIIEHNHVDYPSFMRSLHPSAWKNNYSLLLLNKSKNKITVNDYKLTKEELAWMINHSNGFERLKVTPEEMEPELLKDWFEHPPIYNLRELRNERLRKEGIVK
jgi:hypothetical protein